MKRKGKNWFVQGIGEREWVADVEVGNVHNLGVGYCVFVVVIVERLGVIKGKKILKRPADDVRQGEIPELLLTGLFGPKPKDHGLPLCQRREGREQRKSYQKEGYIG